MAHVAANLKDNTESEEFAALLGETLEQKEGFTGNVTKGITGRNKIPMNNTSTSPKLLDRR